MAKLRPVIAGVLVAFGSVMPAWAGLGSLTLLSGPGEAFYAEITIDPEPGLAAPVVTLAPLERYSILGPYSAGARALRMRTVEVTPGSFMISVTGPVLPRDENLHFALELVWSSGRVVREYHVPAGKQGPLPDDKSRQPQPTLPLDKSSAITGGDGLSFGNGRLLSTRGLPVRAEIELLGDWPKSKQLARQFFLSDVIGLPGEGAYRFAIRERGGRLWLRIAGSSAVQAEQVSFSLQVQLEDAKLVRQFTFSVPKAGLQYQRKPQPVGMVDGYRVRAGDSLSRLAQRFASDNPKPWMDEVFAKNTHAFAHGDRDVLFSGAWLALPGTASKPAAMASPEVTAGQPAPAVAAPVIKPLSEPPNASSGIIKQSPVASSAQASETAVAPEAAMVAKRLQEAQQRMQWLEQEISRLASQPAVTAHAPLLSAQERTFLDENLTEWLLTGLGGLSVASLLAWMLMRRRRHQAVAGDLPFMTILPATTISTGLPQNARPLVQPNAQDINIDAIDLLAEADVLMAYGRFDAAEALLREGLQGEPEREDLRIKLLDLVARKGNRGQFEDQALDVLAISGPESTLWGQVQQLGFALDPANPLYRDTSRRMSDPVVMDNIPAVVNIDSFSQGLDVPVPVPAPAPAPAPAPFELEPEPLRAVDFAANDNRTVSMAGTVSAHAEVEELARLYREMGDSDTADTLLRDAGLLSTPQEAVSAS